VSSELVLLVMFSGLVSLLLTGLPLAPASHPKDAASQTGD
jgi:hypothetical protein